MPRRSDSGPPRHRARRNDGAGKAKREAHNPRAVHPYRDPARVEERARSRAEVDLIRVAGLPSVAELFDSGADRVERLYFEAEHKAAVQPYIALLGRRHKVYRQLGADEMQRVAGTAMHGGVVALARPRPIRDFDPAVADAWAGEGAPLLILDGIGNPQNFGAIARTAAFYGIRRVIVSDHAGQAGLSDAAYRVAKGGLEWIDIYRAHSLPQVLRRLASRWHVIGTAVQRGVRPDRLELGDKPIALVLGNEEDGLSQATMAACTSVVALAGSGRVQSLNVSAAAAILIHTLLARR